MDDQIEFLEETTKETKDIHPFGLMTPVSALQNAARITVWAQKHNPETGQILYWTPIMHFPISKVQKEKLANLEPVLGGLYISCEPDPGMDNLQSYSD